MRVFNFSAGPAALPEPVVQRIREDLPSWQGSGMSVMEVSHRGAPFVEMAERCEARLRSLLGVPDSYRVLFAHGGATSQFAGVPLNLATPEDRADYLVTGHWGTKAVEQGTNFLHVNVAANTADSGFTRVPEPGDITLTGRAAYVHYTPNETIGGVEYPYIPDSGDVPLVADYSSSI
ncbi:MAG: aminotransferase class V-fold PLP-dependent enzyme, partial [Pseudomonadota bacterium]